MDKPLQGMTSVNCDRASGDSANTDSDSGATPQTSLGKPLGIIAGEGKLPQEICEKAQKMGRRPIVLFLSDAVASQNDTGWYKQYTHTCVPLGALEPALAFLAAHNVTEIVFGGRVTRPNLLTFRPDKLGAQWLLRLLPKFGRDDALLRQTIALFEEKGLTVISPKLFLEKDVMAAPKVHWGREMTAQETQDMRQGTALLNALAAHDVGQAAVVVAGRVYGIEAMEGTNKLLQRVGTYHTESPRSGLLVKMAKTQQDLRIDLPVIGVKTMEEILTANLAGIAIKAGDVIMIEPDKIRAFTEQNNLFLHVFQ